MHPLDGMLVHHRFTPSILVGFPNGRLGREGQLCEAKFLVRLLAVRFSIEITLERSTLDMKLGRERREGLGRERRQGLTVSSRPSLFSFNRHFLRTRLLRISYSTGLKRKGGLQAV